MSNFFNLDAPIWVFMGEVADVIILAILWWVCCLGIITIGASTTALYYVLGKKARKESTYVVADFFKSFRMNFRQSMPISIVIIIAGISCFLYLTMIYEAVFIEKDASSLKFILPIALIFLFEFLNVGTYVWALLSRFDMKTKQLVKSAFIMTHRHLLTTAINTVIYIAGVVGVLYFPLLIVFLPGIIIWAQSFMMQRLFTTYIEEAANKEEEEKKAAMAQEEEIAEETEELEEEQDEILEEEELQDVSQETLDQADHSKQSL